MSKQSITASVLSLSRNTLLLIQVAVLSMAALLPVALQGSVSADQLTSRKVTVSSSKSGQTGVTYDFQFSWTVATDVEGIVFQFCDAPQGTCTLPTGMNANRTLTTLGAHTNFPNNGTAFTEFTTDNTGDCDDIDGSADDTEYCVTRTEATSAAGTNATISLGAITNATVASTFRSVYVRVALYNNVNFLTANKVHEGVVAAAMVNQLTTSGRVQERLEFCVGAIDDAAAWPTSCLAANGFPTTTAVDLGVIDSAAIYQSPINDTPPTSLGNDDFGVAMVNTNAQGGVTIGYFPEIDTNVAGGDTDQLRSFRVANTNCDASGASTVDQCFVNANATSTNFTAGAEMFGVYIACTINDGGTTTNLTTANTEYDGTDGSITEAADCENEAANVAFAWNNAGTVANLVSSSTVVDDEAIKLRFGATASATTPTGAYRVVTTYVATPTF